MKNAQDKLIENLALKIANLELLNSKLQVELALLHEEEEAMEKAIEGGI